MAFKEAFEATPEEVILNEDVFTEGKKLEGALANKLDEVQTRLKEMNKATSEGFDADELSQVQADIESQLDESVPHSFKGEYKAAKTGSEAAALIQEHILDKVDSFITQKIEGIV